MNNEIIVNNITFKERNIYRGFDNSISSGELAKDTIINGVTYKKGDWVYFNLDGKISSIYHTLTKDTIINGINFKVNDTIKYNNKGDILAIRWKKLCDGSPNISSIYFYSNGKVKLMMINDETPAINDIEYKLGSDIYFYYNGKVKEGTLKKDTTISGIKYKKGSIIHFYPNGKVRDGQLAKDATIDGITYKADYDCYIWFHDNGKVDHGKLAKDTIINGVIYKADTYVEFSRDKEFVKSWIN